MKKRTKKKIHNRIIKKLISGQTLSGFDKKYHEEMVRKVYVTKPKVHLYADDKLVSPIDEVPTTVRNYVGTTIDEWESELRHTIKYRSVDGRHPMLTIFDEVHQFTKQTSAVADEEVEPSRWQKMTSKVKGWFGK